VTARRNNRWVKHNWAPESRAYCSSLSDELLSSAPAEAETPDELLHQQEGVQVHCCMIYAVSMVHVKLHVPAEITSHCF